MRHRVGVRVSAIRAGGSRPLRTAAYLAGLFAVRRNHASARPEHTQTATIPQVISSAANVPFSPASENDGSRLIPRITLIATIASTRMPASFHMVGFLIEGLSGWSRRALL